MATVGSVRNHNFAKYCLPFFENIDVITTRFTPLISADSYATDFVKVHRVWNFDYRHVVNFFKKISFKKKNNNSPIPYSSANSNPLFRKLLDSFPTNILIGEGGFLYILLGVLKGIFLIKKHNITHIQSSYRPYSDHFIAYFLKIFFPKIYWIADFRDFDVRQDNTYLLGFQRFINKKLLKKAQIVTTVSEGLRQAILPFHNNVYVLRNGIEQTNHSSLITHHSSFIVHHSSFIVHHSSFTLTYTGSLYSNREDARPIFRAIRQLIDNQVIDEKKIKIIYAGKDSALWKSWCEDCDVAHLVEDKGFILRKEALKLQQESQINILLNWCVADSFGIVTSKVFEYFAARRPILAYVKGNKDVELETIFASVNAGLVTYDTPSIVLFLQNAYENWKKTGNVPSPLADADLSQYEWKNQVEQLMSVIL